MVYRAGSYYQICDRCSGKRYNTEMVKTWDNLIVCPKCYDGPRSLLDRPPPIRMERQTVPDPRPASKDRPHVFETTRVTSIADTTATSGGNIVHNGGAPVTAYGVCWSTSHAPDTGDDKTIDGTGTGEFTSTLTGLLASTKYFVRAYATNAVGTSYAPEVEFLTIE